MYKHKPSYKSIINNLKKHVLSRHPTVNLSTTKTINSAVRNQNKVRIYIYLLNYHKKWDIYNYNSICTFPVDTEHQ